MKFSLSLLVSFLSAVVVVAQPGGDQSIVDIAVGNPDFSTLVELLTKADLVDTLSGDGPFTVFAPTNAAFDALGNATEGMEVDALTDILLYHVASGSVTSGMLTDGMMVTMMNGVNATIALDPVMINDASVTTPDVMASNGVIHIIDSKYKSSGSFSRFLLVERWSQLLQL